MTRHAAWRAAAERKGLDFATVRLRGSPPVDPPSRCRGEGERTVAYLAAGPADGPLVLCLHGFPDHAFTWQSLLPRLGSSGWRAVAPWMRGYAPTQISDAGEYQVGALGADVVALHDALAGGRRAALVGHDWGAVAVYAAAATTPERWSRVVTLAVPPRPAFLPAALADPRQWLRSAYIGFFQLPFLPEWVLGRDNAATLDRLWTSWWNGYRDDHDFRSRLLDTFTSPGTLSAALGYYRALFNPARRNHRFRALDRAALAVPPQPLLYLHGEDDEVIGARYAQRARAVLGSGSHVATLADAGHFLHLEHPAEVDARILDHLCGANAR